MAYLWLSKPKAFCLHGVGVRILKLDWPFKQRLSATEFSTACVGPEDRVESLG